MKLVFKWNKYENRKQSEKRFSNKMKNAFALAMGRALQVYFATTKTVLKVSRFETT